MHNHIDGPLSAPKNLDYPKKNNPMYTQMLNILFMNKKYVRFLWVPGLNNITGNDIVEEMAKTAIKEPAELSNITTHHDTTLLISINLNKRCQQEWRLVKNNKLREIKSTILSWVHDMSLSRRTAYYEDLQQINIIIYFCRLLRNVYWYAP